ncbi:hypothetical protein BTR23_01710 [Alkalihalophilus pseudofirmus]|uniref:hypothetical protein n=1 Tax=Alkalihalobacterium alkalinitrilicum TaxID=427920 RepID=UPI00094DE9FA|nr:hypothetical protein [Alkalihalobacterium alkalinitrilicum]OLO42743.1 hypothetical protein BTR23_01710 [Alkalihalophilus pseudofirmus]
MRVHDLVETKEFFVGETKPNFHVIYEKFENNDAVYVDGMFQIKKIGTEEIIQIFRGEEDTLCNVERYCIGKDYPDIEAVLAKVKMSHKEIFI